MPSSSWVQWSVHAIALSVPAVQNQWRVGRRVWPQAAMQRQPRPACGQGASPSAPLVVTRGDVLQSASNFSYPSVIRVRQVSPPGPSARSRIVAAVGAQPFREPQAAGMK